MVRLNAILRDPLKLKQAIAPVVWVWEDPFWHWKLIDSIFYRTQWWKDVPLGPPDIILGIFEAFKVDPNPNKVDLSVGAYRCELGKPYVLKSILKAEQNLVKRMPDKESDSEIGSQFFRDMTFRLAVGEKLSDRPHVSVQVRGKFSSSFCAVFYFLSLFSISKERQWQWQYQNSGRNNRKNLQWKQIDLHPRPKLGLPWTNIQAEWSWNSILQILRS